MCGNGRGADGRLFIVCVQFVNASPGLICKLPSACSPCVTLHVCEFHQPYSESSLPLPNSMPPLYSPSPLASNNTLPFATLNHSFLKTHHRPFGSVCLYWNPTAAFGIHHTFPNPIRRMRKPQHVGVEPTHRWCNYKPPFCISPNQFPCHIRRLLKRQLATGGTHSCL